MPENDELASEACTVRVERRCNGITPCKRCGLHGAKILVVLRSRHATR